MRESANEGKKKKAGKEEDAPTLKLGRRKKNRKKTNLVDPDLAVRDQAHHQHVAQRPRLPQRVRVAVVHHVEAAVHIHTHGRAPAPAARVPGQGAREEGGDGPGAVVVLLVAFFLFSGLVSFSLFRGGAWKQAEGERVSGE